MFSVGIDSVEIERIARSIENDRFINRVYGDDELCEIKSRGMHPRSFAVCFAAKEAFSKALGTGISGFALKEVQLVHLDSGAPCLSLSGNALKLASEQNLSFSVSVTHTDSVATVIVLGYRG